MDNLKEIEFTSEYRIQGFIFPPGTRCRLYAGAALTLVDRQQAKFVKPGRTKNADRLDDRTDKGAHSVAGID